MAARVDVGVEDALTCPVGFDPLLTAVSLIPCAHKLNENWALRMFGAVLPESKACEKHEPCPKCRTVVQSYAPDHTVRALAEHFFSQPNPPAQIHPAPPAAKPLDDETRLQLITDHFRINREIYEPRLEREKLMIVEEAGWPDRFLICRERSSQLSFFRISREVNEIGSKRILTLSDLKNQKRHCVLVVSASKEGIDEAPFYKLIRHKNYYHNVFKPHLWSQVGTMCYALYDQDRRVSCLRESEIRTSWPQHPRIMDALLGVWDVHQIGYTLGRVEMVTFEGRDFVFDLSRVEKGDNPQRAAEDVYALGVYLYELLKGKGSFKGADQIVVPREEWPIEAIIQQMCDRDWHRRPTMLTVVSHACTWQALPLIHGLDLPQREHMRTVVMARHPYDNEGLSQLCLFAEEMWKKEEVNSPNKDRWRLLFVCIRSLWIAAPQPPEDGAGPA